MRVRVATTTAALALCAVALLAAARPRPARAHLGDMDTPGAAPGAAHMSPMPFLMNVRYGRSSSDRRHLEPRADRFFMGTRYGKRSHSVGVGVEEEGDEETALVCRYTGVMALYRCYQRSMLLEDSREEDPSPDERERR